MKACVNVTNSHPVDLFQSTTIPTGPHTASQSGGKRTRRARKTRKTRRTGKSRRTTNKKRKAIKKRK